ncbi:MAG TPA: phosphoglucomutase/phosphomannomutase family protein, partial [Thermotoga sp.]|nr:phosphoglucomutase/phosphomannomutase family protein [Thermotoga sp.]
PSEESLTYLMDVMRSGEYDVGIAVDGDADRIALVDETGRFLHPNDVLPLLYYYLHEFKNQKGPAVRNVATSHNLDRLAKKLRERVIETPVGFKHIAKAMIENDALIGGESSGGITFKNHIMEKDGVFTAMLVVEMLAKMKKKLSEILREMIEFSETWYSFYQENLRLTPTLRVKAEKFLKRDFDKIAEFPVIDVIRIDGTKYILEDGSWVLLRLSGTEPLLRIIAESENKEKAKELVEWMRRRVD